MTGIHAIGRSPNRTMDFWRRSVGCDADGSRRSMGSGHDPAGVINEMRCRCAIGDRLLSRAKQNAKVHHPSTRGTSPARET